MSIYSIIKQELDNNPGVYGSLTDQQIADALNNPIITVQRDTISGQELFGYTNEAEYAALSDAKKSQWLSLCAIDTVTQTAVPIIKDIFPAGTATWTGIVKTKSISRGEQIGIGSVAVGDIINARAQ